MPRSLYQKIRKQRIVWILRQSTHKQRSLNLSIRVLFVLKLRNGRIYRLLKKFPLSCEGPESCVFLPRVTTVSECV